ncbi:Mitochondrial carrier protein MTM1 [Diplonema papillatum]|nr:Mitochondrial carrier protein MTM1 [Diplonema papillatum]
MIASEITLTGQKAGALTASLLDTIKVPAMVTGTCIGCAAVPHLGQPHGAGANGAPELTTVQRMQAAVVGSCLVALTMTPLDVAKVKMQSSARGVTRATRPGYSYSYPCAHAPGLVHSERHRFAYSGPPADGDRSRIHWKSEWPCYKKVATPARASRLTTLGVLKSTLQREGLAGAYAGFFPTVLMSVPNNVLYFAAYEAIRDELRGNSAFPSRWAPVLAGGFSRVLATATVAPLEFIRTRRQSGMAFNDIHSAVGQEGFRSLWRGVVPTLWRDIPFSMIYWASLEHLRSVYVDGALTSSSRIFSTFLCGGFAGCFAACCTMPFDVVKTRAQVQLQQKGTRRRAPSLVDAFRTIVRHEGPAALFAGLIPRIMRAGPSCAIMIGAYEAAKHYLVEHAEVERAAET